MHLSDSESALLKAWTIRKLEDISDADSDVLADYVAALIEGNASEAAAKASCISSLNDFLGEKTEPFVNEVFEAIATKAYDPLQPPLKATAPIYQPPKRQSFESPRLPNESRKRSYHDWDRDASSNLCSVRPAKAARWRGDGTGAYRATPRSQTHQSHGLPRESVASQLPTLPPGMPPFDPNDPMASMIAMQQMFSMFSGMANSAPPSNGYSSVPAISAQRCSDYDLKGFCAAGTSCPYEHGENPLVIPGMSQEYDPSNSSLVDVTPSHAGHVDTRLSNRGRGTRRGRGRGRGEHKGSDGRSEFGHLGPSREPSNTSIVVERIPSEQCNEESIRGFFEDFGEIEEVTVHESQNLAIIKYDNHYAAKSAYQSPKVVFDNRFVKVYWQKLHGKAERATEPETNMKTAYDSTDISMQDEEPIDLIEFSKRQQEAQARLELAKKHREDAEKQKQVVEQRLEAMAAERKTLLQSIAKKAGSAQPGMDGLSIITESEETEHTKALKAQLAQVKAEAKSLGLDPDAAADGSGGYGAFRGRGGYRGGYRGRASYRGQRGSWPGFAARGGAVKRLDNRPKTVSVTFEQGSYDTHDEAMRQFLLFNNLDHASLARHPDREDIALLAFEQRYEGENFMAAAGKSDLLHVGKVELAWYKPSEAGGISNGAHGPGEKAPAVEVEQSASPDVEIIDGYDAPDEEDLDRWT